eukprot:11276844-Alexandrium_andersonii.AAC.1
MALPPPWVTDLPPLAAVDCGLRIAAESGLQHAEFRAAGCGLLRYPDCGLRIVADFGLPDPDRGLRKCGLR